MRRHLFIGLLGLVGAGGVQADSTTIDLDCQQQGALLIERVEAEQIVDLNQTQADRIKQLAVELCTGSEQIATEQHKKLEANAVKNWFTSDHLGGKKGNERLKRIK